MQSESEQTVMLEFDVRSNSRHGALGHIRATRRVCGIMSSGGGSPSQCLGSLPVSMFPSLALHSIALKTGEKGLISYGDAKRSSGHISEHIT